MESRDDKGRFLTGNSGGGRPKGARSKLGEGFLCDLFEDWQEHGQDAIRRARESKPHEYLKVIASLIPKQRQIGENPFDDVTDDELRDMVGALHAALRLAN